MGPFHDRGEGHSSYYPGVWNKDVADGREEGQMEGKGHDNVHTHHVLKTSLPRQCVVPWRRTTASIPSW